ncbi:MAG: sigma-54 dependent transcriptional regulator [Planctomycetota bacterium]
MLARVVLAVQKPALRKKLRAALKHPDVLVSIVTSKRLSWENVANENADLAVVDEAVIPEPVDKTVRRFRDLRDSPEVIVVSEAHDPEVEGELLAAGCRAVLSADLRVDSLADVIEALVAERRERAASGLLAREPLAEPRLTDFVSESPAMAAFMRTARRVVPSDISLLILGETGVGKERLAMAIHAEGPRTEGPFVAVNCGALPETLLESELFGHEEGAFTGATRDRRGMFELAHRGTVFLDEIGDMPRHLQVKLLRVLQEHTIRRLGSEKTIAIDVRVMAASNRDIEADVEAGRFRKDLYYRLGVVTLAIPPLRARREDIPALVDSYLAYLQTQVGRDVTGITDEALEALTRYAWPGNVRELINIVERAMLLCEDDTIALNDLPHAIRRLGPSVVEADDLPGVAALPADWLTRPIEHGRQQVIAGFERAYLQTVLREEEGRVGRTAKRAGIQPRSLYDKMKKYGLRKEDFKPGE